MLTPPSRRKACVLVALASLALVSTTKPARAQTPDYQVLRDFQQAPVTFSRVVHLPDGRVFGTAESGGPRGRGTVWMLQPDGIGGFTSTTVAVFDGSNGSNPASGLMLANDGNMYGTAPSGPTGRGVVFRVTQAGVFSVFAALPNSPPHASSPRAGLTQGADGALYGTTLNGGANGRGTLFRLTLDGSFSVLHSFTGGGGGEYPYGAALLASDGMIYGTTYSGGTANNYGCYWSFNYGYSCSNLGGTVYRFAPGTGVFTIIHSFTGGPDGQRPYAGLIQAPDGHLYGTAYQGGDSASIYDQGYGTAYRIHLPSGAFQRVHSFNNSSGTHPYEGTLTLDNAGNLVGAASRGGSTGRGLIFRLVPSTGTVSTLHSFTTDQLAYPDTGLSLGADGRVWGTSRSYGGYSNSGTVFAIDSMGGGLTLEHEFSHLDGHNVYTGLARRSSGDFIGTTYQGGAYDRGTVFRIDSSGTYQVLQQLGANNGAYPYLGSTPILGADGYVYGTAQGAPGNGIVYRVSPAGAYSVWRVFNNYYTEGATPSGITQASSGDFYVTMSGGGTNGRGAIVRLTSAGALSLLHSFNNDEYPRYPLAEGPDGNFYGVLENGGIPDGSGTRRGGVFRLTTTGAFTLLHSFTGMDGSYPVGGLTLASDGLLYGTTQSGGSFGTGTMFSLAPATGAVTSVHSFTSNSSGPYSPYARLKASADGALYGTTLYGGASQRGTIYRFVPGSSGITVVSSIPNNGGAYPYAPLAQGTDGALYGTTCCGGAAERGTVFRVKAPATVTVSNLAHTYDGTAKSAAVTTDPAGLAVTITYRVSGVPVASPTNAGSYAVEVVINDPNIQGRVTGTMVIAKAAATLSLSGLTHVYSGAQKSATVATDPTGLSGVTVTYNGSTALPVAVGTYAVLASLTNANYQAPAATGSLIIAKASATLSLGGLSHTYTGGAKNASVTTTPVGLTGVTLTYNGGSALPINAGSYAVVASLMNSNYEAVSATGSLEIAKASATLTLGGLNHTYDGAPKSATATTTPGGLSGVTLTYDGNPTPPTSAGNYAVVASLTNANYAATNATGTLAIAKASATLTLGGLTHTYDGTPKSATATTTPGGLGGVTLTYDGNPSPPTSAGNYVVVASLTNANYAATNATGTLAIAKASATLTLGGLSHTYDGTPKSATATTVPGGLSGVTLTYDGNPTPPTSAGNYVVVASLTNANYAATNATGTLAIAKASATLTLGGLSHTYDGAPKSATATTTPGGLSGVTLTYDGNPTPPTSAGNYVVVASLTNANYAATNATGTLAIAKASATLTLGGLSHTYNGAAKGATATTTPAGLTGVTLTYNGGTSLPINSGSYSVVASLTNANYEAPSATGSLEIAKASATLSLGGLTHTYDGAAKSATATTTPVGLSGVSFTYNGGTSLPINSGSYAVVASLTNANYDAVSVTGALQISKAMATVSLANLVHTYDGTAKAATVGTTPAGLNVALIYAQGVIPVTPVGAGIYDITAAIAEVNYQGAATGQLVINAPPTLTSITGPTGPIALGGSTTIAMAFSDSATGDVHTCTFSWDDGASPQSVNAAGGICSAPHSYGAAGVYEVAVTVTDDDGLSATGSFQYVVVYDPTAGFVTGGGWVQSAPGSYVADAALAGKASFGFVSRYKRGQSVPTGETQFQFELAAFRFQSVAYEWLVISGARAQYKGVGTVNGAGSYGFLLTATDGEVTGGGGVDRFRIKVWEVASGAVVYDNVLGAADTLTGANPQALGGGSVVIHAK